MSINDRFLKNINGLLVTLNNCQQYTIGSIIKLIFCQVYCDKLLSPSIDLYCGYWKTGIKCQNVISGDNYLFIY